MKYSPVFFFLFLALLGFTNSQDTPTEETGLKSDDERLKHLRVLLIPADVLRDFPGMCFASTRCATIKPGETWELVTFCGRSTCIVSEDDPPRLLELVEDCGPAPLPNPKCSLDTEKSNKTAPYPACCPVFKCENGATLEYPKLPTPAATEDEEDGESKK